MSVNIEILSPAGDMKCFEAAVANGADAVYLGGKLFSARKNASNFDDDELRYAVDYAHLRDVKVYVALNTLIQENETEDCFRFIQFCYNIGVDALIVQDMGVLYIIKKYFPDFRVHASTQMTIHNTLGVSKASELGFKRVVLSRELSYRDIKAITEKNICETEVFAHGALCMCYSGQCLMSSFIGGRSGNRGACAQPCRLKYTVCDSEKNPIGISDRYYMSLKDLCLADEISNLTDAGVDSLKIEGRMKNSEYVSIVTAMYNKYRYGASFDKGDMALLENVFSRNGFTKGYVHGNTGAHMLNIDRNNDDVYANTTVHVHDKAKELMNVEKTNPVDVYVEIKLGANPRLVLKNDRFTVECVGDEIVEKALKSATDSERVFRQISKFGGSAFSVRNISGDIDEGINIPISVLNDLRRRAISAAEEKLISAFKRNSKVCFEYEPYDKTKKEEPMLSASVLTEQQAKAAYDAGFDRIYISYEVYTCDRAFFDENSDVFALKLPSIMPDGSESRYKDVGLDTICISNLSQLGMFKDKNIHGDYSLNVYNSYAQRMYKSCGVDSICMSPELNINQLGEIENVLPTEIVVYGRIKLMTVKNCFIKSSKLGCGCDENKV